MFIALICICEYIIPAKLKIFLMPLRNFLISLLPFHLCAPFEARGSSILTRSTSTAYFMWLYFVLRFLSGLRQKLLLSFLLKAAAARRRPATFITFVHTIRFHTFLLLCCGSDVNAGRASGSGRDCDRVARSKAIKRMNQVQVRSIGKGRAIVSLCECVCVLDGLFL